MTEHRFTFSKQERIVSQKLMDELFSGNRSHSMAAFPLRAVYLQKERQPGQPPVVVLISVPKKRLKHAVDRNRVKRQVREAYRHHKELLTGRVAASESLAVAFIWQAGQLLPSADIDHKIRVLLERIGRKAAHGERPSS